MRRLLAIGAAASVAVAAAVTVSTAGASSSGRTAQEGTTTEYVVLAEDGASLAQARAAVKAAGGTVVAENAAVGMLTVRTSAVDFAATMAADGRVTGAARDTVIGQAPARRRGRCLRRREGDRRCGYRRQLGHPGDPER